MLILRFFGENSPRIIAESGADPAVLKTGSQALVYLIRVVYFDHLLEPLKCVLHLLF